MQDRSQPPSRSGLGRAVVLVKALPQVSESHGETVCVAAVDEYGCWHRLYPVNFRDLGEKQRFGRWDQIEFNWRLPEVSKDRRAESKRVEQSTIRIVGKLKKSERQRYLAGAVICSPASEYKAGRSLAVIRPEAPRFSWKRRSIEEVDKVQRAYELINASPDLFGTKDIVPREASPFEFRYDYIDEDGPHSQRCHDWETEQTFLKWRNLYGEERALKEMSSVFGEQYPAKGMAFVLGTHGQRNWQWMIIGILRLDHSKQVSFL